jgi:hypothetical protein
MQHCVFTDIAECSSSSPFRTTVIKVSIADGSLLSDKTQLPQLY